MTSAEAKTTAAHTREVLATALLAAIGGLGLFGPLATLGLMASGMTGMSSHHAAHLGPIFLEQLGSVAPSMPAACVAATFAAVGLYRRSPWGRRLGVAVAFLLVLAPVVMLVAMLAAPAAAPATAMPEDLAGSDLIATDLTPAIDSLLYHAFLTTRAAIFPAAIYPVLGFVIIWGLLAKPRPVRVEPVDQPGAGGEVGSSPAAPSSPRPRLAMVILAILALLALAPYLAWIATVPLGLPQAGVAATTGLGAVALAPSVAPSGAAPSGWDFGIGILVAIPTAIASGLAFVGARAIRSRQPIGPYLAPAAAAIAGPWSAIWLFVVALRFSNPSDTGDAAVGPVGWLFVGLALMSALSFFPVTIGVLRRRTWFFERGLPPVRARSAKRQWSALVGLIPVALAPIGVGAVAWAIDPPSEALYYNEVLLGDKAYRYAAPLDLEPDGLESVGVLAAWTEDLRITSIDVRALPGTAAERAIVVHGGPSGSAWAFSLFMPSNGDMPERIPSELCSYVPLEDPTVFVDPCGPPADVQLAGVRYEQVGDPGSFTVRAGDLAPIGMTLVSLAASPLDRRVDLRALSISGVPTSDAIALLIGERVVLYRVSGRYGPGELCRLSPAAVANPFPNDEKESAGVESGPPFGCGFPETVWLNSTSYAREQRDRQLFDVPVDALTPLGTAQVEMGELGPGNPEGRQPFPPTVDATAYAIDGVDPIHAIAFVVKDEVVVMRPKDLGAPIPPGLCAYARLAVIEELEAQGDGPFGCAH